MGRLWMPPFRPHPFWICVINELREKRRWTESEQRESANEQARNRRESLQITTMKFITANSRSGRSGTLKRRGSGEKSIEAVRKPWETNSERTPRKQKSDWHGVSRSPLAENIQINDILPHRGQLVNGNQWRIGNTGTAGTQGIYFRAVGELLQALIQHCGEVLHRKARNVQPVRLYSWGFTAGLFFCPLEDDQSVRSEQGI